MVELSIRNPTDWTVKISAGNGGNDKIRKPTEAREHLYKLRAKEDPFQCLSQMRKPTSRRKGAERAATMPLALVMVERARSEEERRCPWWRDGNDASKNRSVRRCRGK